MSPKQAQALSAAVVAVLVAASAFLPQYAALFTAIGGFVPSLWPAVVGLLSRRSAS